MAARLAIKVDVDTHDGLRLGGPGILEILARHGVRASFFVSFGPDRSGRAVLRVFRRKGFLAKMLRTNAVRMYGLRTMLSGTLLPARPIGVAFPELVRRMDGEGHEVAVHAWDHGRWQDQLARIGAQGVRAELESAFDAYEWILGRRPHATAAPGWQADAASLSVLEELGLEYASDARGRGPFLPVCGGRAFRTPQLPTTLGTLDEDLGRVTDEEGYVGWLADRLPPEGTSVLTVHTETEGMAFAALFDRLLLRLRESGVKFITLRELAAGSRALPRCELAWGEVPGRAGPVAVQGDEVRS